MTQNPKIGDKVYNKLTPESVGIILDIDKSKGNLRGGLVKIKIVQDNYYEVDQIVFWYYDSCVLYEDKKIKVKKTLKICDCAINILMSKGCQCGNP